ncbi:hypothetical protein [Lysobacter sp. Root690]|uniref:hypothetical protein n=1 Tax=Lysobacter sp. Root690 TaxID=1736588 RepID=UPI000A3EA94C|nr:hypothetical protein [Lysobacter sp. Root690]
MKPRKALIFMTQRRRPDAAQTPACHTRKKHPCRAKPIALNDLRHNPALTHRSCQRWHAVMVSESCRANPAAADNGGKPALRVGYAIIRPRWKTKTA